MGLDVALGVLVLLAAIRGWFQGFILQAIRLGGLVGCVYLATPVRDLVRPWVREHLATISPELLDKLLWWAAAAASYVVTTGLATWLVKAFQRRPSFGPRPVGTGEPANWVDKTFRSYPYGEPDPYRGNQSAGALLGAAKGLIIVAFLAAGLAWYAPDYLKSGGWVGEQVQTSRVLDWSQRHQPAARIWDSPPVRMFVDHVRRMGLQAPADEPDHPKDEPEAPPVQTASRPKPLSIPSPPDRLNPSAPDFNLDKALDTVRDELRRREASKTR